MTGSGSQSACTAIHTEFPYMQYSKGDFVKSSDDADTSCQRTPTEPLTDADKRAAINRAAQAVERAFLAYHETGCFDAAAAYKRARNTWAQMLMQWGRIA